MTEREGNRAWKGALCFLFLAACGPRAWAQELPGWDLVWSDEFAQTDGSAPDATKWTYDIGRGSNGWGNLELQYYTSRTENARIEGNELVIEVREEPNYLGSGANYTSARLLTQGKWVWKYGRFEARIRVPGGSGLWPAFWMLGNDITTVGWPQCGEIDIMEFVGRKPQEIFGTIHGPGYSGGESYESIYDFGEDVPGDYHVYAVEWEEGEIRWYVDGILYHTANPADVAPGQWVFDHDFFLLLNVAVGGNFGGPVDGGLEFPKQMNVDYVRVYVPEGDGNRLINPGLETGSLNGWTPYEAGGANDPGAFVESTGDTYYNGGSPGGDKVLTRSGAYAAKVFGDFTGAANSNGFYQELPVEPGSVWTGGGWALTHPQDLMVGTNTAWLEVSFRDGAGAVLKRHRSEILTAANVTPANWENLVVETELDPESFAVVGSGQELVAPEGAVVVRFQIVYRQEGNYDGGSMYFDDLSLVEQVAVPLEPCLEMGSVVSWEASGETSEYQLQESSNGSDWSDVGEALEGVGESSYFVQDAAPFYRVLEMMASGPGNGVANGGLEVTEEPVHPSPGAVGWRIAVPEDEDVTDGEALMSVQSAYEGYSPRTGSQMLVIESTTPPEPAQVMPPDSDVRGDFVEVVAGESYELRFHAAHVVKIGGANPQMNIRFYHAGAGLVGETGFESFASAGSGWTEIVESFTVPAGAVFAEVSWIQALGAGNGWRWVTLIDDVEILTENAPGAEVVLPVEVEPGFEISWETAVGKVYQVYSSLELPVISNVESTVVGDGARARYKGAVGVNGRRFFRIGEMPN